MILRHKDTVEAFKGYEYNIASVTERKKSKKKEMEMFTHTTMNLKRK